MTAKNAPARLQRWVYAAVTALTIAIGTWLFWPTLEIGLFADDYVAAAVVDGTFSAPRGRYDVFNFASGTPEDVAAAQRLGSLPWWTPADFRVSFFRPLSSALWHIDRALFGHTLWLYHLHSIAVWAVLGVAASVFYRRLLPWTAAALATAIFALDQSQHVPVQWLCNRGGIYAVLCGVLALLAHLDFRERKRIASAWLSASLIGIGMLFGEWMLPMLAYIAAYELVERRESLRVRALALLPSALPTLGYLIVRASLGYGVRHSGVYVDPSNEPLRFLRLLTHRIPVLTADMLFDLRAQYWDHGSPWRDRILQSGLIPPDVWERMPNWHAFHTAIGWAAIGVLVILYFLSRGLPEHERRQARWLATGALLALIPVAGSFPSTRLTLAAMFGMAGVIALLIRQLGRLLVVYARGGLPRFLVLFAASAAFVQLQLVAPLLVDEELEVSAQSRHREWVIAAPLDPKTIAQQRVFLLSCTDFISSYFFAYTWGYHGRPLPRSSYAISGAPLPLDVERIADNELELRVLGGTLFTDPGEQMFRPARFPFAIGSEVAVDGMKIRIQTAFGGRPQTIRAVFEHPLEDPSYVFLVSTQIGFQRFIPPPIGGIARLPRPSAPNWIAMQKYREYLRIGPVPDVFAYAPVPGFVLYKPQ